jgi:hypothetical protein
LCCAKQIKKTRAVFVGSFSLLVKQMLLVAGQTKRFSLLVKQMLLVAGKRMLLVAGQTNASRSLLVKQMLLSLY